MSMLPWRTYSLDAVKEIPIVQVCDRLGLPVTRRGKSYWCKLRDERTASAILHPENNTFYDFGTQDHGSNIDLVCSATGKSVSEAVRYLGDTFSLTPETPADARKRFQTMSRADYARIGLHADLATKNFTFPITRCMPDKLLDIELKYQMPMNQLRKQHPKTYERLIREKAVPYVESLRNLYYLDIWDHYCFLQSTGRTVLFYDSDRTHAYFASLTQQMEQAERSLYKAAQGTSIDLPEPKHYDPMRVISRFLTDRLSISVGSCTLKELSNMTKGRFSQLQLSHDAYFGAALDDILHAATLTKDHVLLSCKTQDLSLVKRRLYLQAEHTKAPALSHTIQAAALQKNTVKQTSKQPESSISR